MNEKDFPLDLGVFQPRKVDQWRVGLGGGMRRGRGEDALIGCKSWKQAPVQNASTQPSASHFTVRNLGINSDKNSTIFNY